MTLYYLCGLLKNLKPQENADGHQSRAGDLPASIFVHLRLNSLLSSC